MATGIERGSCLWTTGASADDLTGSGLAMSMSTVKLEGVGEGMFAELTEDMLERIGCSLDFYSTLAFIPLLLPHIFCMITLDQVISVDLASRFPCVISC